MITSYKEIINKHLSDNFFYYKDFIENQSIGEMIEEMIYEMQNELCELIDEDPESLIPSIKVYIFEQIYHKFLSTIIQRNLEDVYRDYQIGQ